MTFLLRAVSAAGKSCDCYLGLLFTMEDVAVYGYITPLKIKIIVAIQLSDSVVKDVEIISVSLYFYRANSFFFENLARYSRPFTWPTIHQSRTHF